MLRALVIFLFPLTAIASGDFFFEDDLEPILKKDKNLGEVILKNFDFPIKGLHANRIDLPYMNLRGKRVGPYSTKAKIKGTKEVVWITIETHQIFLINDNPVHPNEYQATDVIETLATFKVVYPPKN